MLSNEEMYPYTAKEARDRGELELWRANFRSNCACAGAIELAIRRDFDGMHLKEGCAESVIEQYGYKRVGYVLANTLQMQSYDGRYHRQGGGAVAGHAAGILLAAGEPIVAGFRWLRLPPSRSRPFGVLYLFGRR